MVISQTPYRVSFAGGGTDLPAFFERECGAVVSVALAHHMYVTVHRRFERNWRIAYSKTELAARRELIEHELVREALRVTEVAEPLEVTTVGDVPAGTGLGSSSSLTVGLLNALHAYAGRISRASQLGEEACRIEIDILKKPIGKQDQYAAAFGGLNYIRFNCDGSVDVEPVPARRAVVEELERWSLLLYTDRQRDASSVLQRQTQAIEKNVSSLRRLRELADLTRWALVESPDPVKSLAELLHEGWMVKRSLGCGVANDLIDKWYALAREAGASGGKLLGAGGGGFLLLIAPPDCHGAIRKAVGFPRELDFKVDRHGSRITFISDIH